MGHVRDGRWMSAEEEIKVGIVVAAVTGVFHWIWQLVGLPCIYPIIKAWLKKHGAAISRRFDK